MSKLNYIITVWGGTEEYLLNALQVIQNRAARCVTKLSWFTPTRTLLKNCGWLSVRQLIFYNTVVMTHKISITGTPRYMHGKLFLEYGYRTRQATQRGVRFGDQFPGKTALTKSSFLYRAALDYNSIPTDIRSARTIEVFKKKLKSWIRPNIPVQ